MALFIGIDLGTTTITALALCDAGAPVVAVRSVANDTRINTGTSTGQQPEHFEWDAEAIAVRAEDCLRLLVDDLGDRRGDVASLGVTGQQHGVVVIDDQLRPRTPFINWQDRRGEEYLAGSDRTYVDEAHHRLGPDAWRRAGCTLATGHLGLTLYWLQSNDRLPRGTACSIMDYVTARLIGGPACTEPTCAAASGLLHIASRDWDRAAIDSLRLPRDMFPPIREAGEQAGGLANDVARRVGLKPGIPVATPTGDQQAGFVGSVTDREHCGHLNVGTGAQVAAFVESSQFAPPLELRPFPIAGNLLTGAVLCGGWSYQVLEQFFRGVGRDVLGMTTETRSYQRLNELAESIPPGADGLICEPLFAGTRADPARRAAWRGMTARNFTPAHMTRALLEGMARAYAEQLAAVQEQGGRTLTRLVATGNAMRENRLLCELVSHATSLPLTIPHHREEAAFGAALLAAMAAKRFSNLQEATERIDYGT